MIVMEGYGGSTIVTKGYGGQYFNPFVRCSDFEKSFYKYIEDNYTSYNDYNVYYGRVRLKDLSDIWISSYFVELNVETGVPSSAIIEINTRLSTLDEYDNRLKEIVDDMRATMINAFIPLYDFTYPENVRLLQDSIIRLTSMGKNVYERVSSIEIEGVSHLIQSAMVSVKMKLIKSFSRGRNPWKL